MPTNNNIVLLYTDPANGTRHWKTLHDENALNAEVDRIDAAHPGFADMDANTIEGPNSPGWLAFCQDAGYGVNDQLPDETESDLWYVVYTDASRKNTWTAYEGAKTADTVASRLRTHMTTPVTIFSYDDYEF